MIRGDNVLQSSRPARAAMAACLALGVADLLFIDGVVLPRVLSKRAPDRSAAPARPAAAPARESALPAAPERAAPQPREMAPPAEAPALPSPRAPAAPPAPELIVHFASGEALLDAHARGALDALGARVARHGEWTFAIEGHADARGDAAFNERLSQQRARAVALRLRARGLVLSRMQISAFGSTRPISSGDDPVSLRRNRRVEIIIARGAP
jgi:outer membrane protein OmpA-like peptidoglycan-associated protein